MNNVTEEAVENINSHGINVVVDEEVGQQQAQQNNQVDVGLSVVYNQTITSHVLQTEENQINNLDQVQTTL